jgi:hypothetical protein
MRRPLAILAASGVLSVLAAAVIAAPATFVNTAWY